LAVDGQEGDDNDVVVADTPLSVQYAPAEAVEGVKEAVEDGATAEPLEPDVPQLSQEEAEAKVAEYRTLLDAGASAEARAREGKDMAYCPECYLPLHPDPKPEKLYIFLHALRYTTSLGCFETDMPVWAAKGWEWDRS
jgi:tRNA pseudouridine32 synthase